MAATDRDGLASRLVVYVVPRRTPSGEPLGSPDACGTDLRRRFGRSLLPALFRTLDVRLPRTLAGKIDRRRLPDPGPLAAGTERPPDTPTEKELAALWSELTGTARIGAQDSFFTAGRRFAAGLPTPDRIRGRFAVEVSAEEFYANQTLAGLSALVDRSR